MNRRDVFTLALAALLLVPVATAYTPGASEAPETGTALQSNDAQPTSTPGAGGDTTATDGNYSRLYIDNGYLDAELKPGTNTSLDVTVGNSDDRPVELNPRVVLPRLQGRPVEKSWVSFEPGEATVAPDEEREFTVTIAVPEDADLGSYNGQIAFTNQTVSYRGGPDRPVHATALNVEVRQEPSVSVSGDRYRFAQIRAGSSTTYVFSVENTGSSAVPLNPRVQTDRGGPFDESAVDRSWFDIEAPTDVGPGETANVTVTVSPPSNASLGEYGAQIDLGLKDPNRPDRAEFWQEVSLSFQVWEQPDEPYSTEFRVREDGTEVTVTLEASQYRVRSTDEPVSFDVTLVGPNGNEYDPERVTVTNGGSVSLGGEERPSAGADQQGPYVDRTDGIEFTYRLENAEVGRWTVEIMPRNTIDFDYEIVQGDSDETDD